MLSNLATYFFGGNEQPADQEPSLDVKESPEGVLVSNPSPTNGLTMIVNGSQGTAHSNARLEKSISEDTEDEWVMVADTTHPDPLTLGSLSEPNPRPPTGSTGSSTTPSESGDEDEDGIATSPSMNVDQAPEVPGRPVAFTRSARRLTSPFSCQASASLSQLKAMRSAQVAKQKKSAKATTAKTIERKNKAVKNNQVSFSKKAFTNRNNLAIKAAGANKQLKQC